MDVLLRTNRDGGGVNLNEGSHISESQWGSTIAVTGIGAESWYPVDISAAVTGGWVEQAPTLLQREDGACLLYAGKVHSLSGESESLKTWLALLAAAEIVTAGQHALFIDYEDSADGIVRRLLALGCAPGDLLDRFSYVRPTVPYGAEARAVLGVSIADRPPLVIIDGVTEAMASHGLDPLSNADAAKFNATLPGPLALGGSAVVMIDHVTKSRETRGRYALGAQHKLAAITGAAYTVELIKPFAAGQHGMAKITLAKDRLGRIVAPGREAGLLHLESQYDGSVLARIEAPADRAAEGAGGFRPTALMEKVSRLLESGSGLTARAIRGGVKGNNEAKQLALELLVAEGFVTVRKQGSSNLHHLVRPFRQGGGNQ